MYIGRPPWKVFGFIIAHVFAIVTILLTISHSDAKIPPKAFAVGGRIFIVCFSCLLFHIKARVEGVEVLRIELVGDEAKGFAEIINLSKSLQIHC